MIDLVSNDYLSLARDPRVIEGACQAARVYGASASSSRAVVGTLPIHTELETRLAAWLDHPAVAICSTGYHANLAAVTTVGDRGAPLIVDAHAHASLIDGARLARRDVWFAAHNDVADVARLLQAAGPGALVLVESIYSVWGDAAPLADLVLLTAQHQAFLLVDEAHALGVVGPGGRGCLAAVRAARPDVEVGPHVVVTGTLSKSFASRPGSGGPGTPRALRP